MSSSVNLMENQVSMIDAIQTIPWFHDLTPSQIDRLAKISRIQSFQSDEELFHEGDRVENLYIILSGEVVLENYIPTMGNHIVAHAEPLDVIGWSCLTPVVRQRTATVKVLKAARMITIKGEDLIKLCENDSVLGYIIMRRVANIVASQFLSTRLYLYEIIRNATHSLTQSGSY
jgi:CRP/FNR family cyclic AMP-dependent transcriptional regulator